MPTVSPPLIGRSRKAEGLLLPSRCAGPGPSNREVDVVRARRPFDRRSDSGWCRLEVLATDRQGVLVAARAAQRFAVSLAFDRPQD